MCRFRREARARERRCHRGADSLKALDPKRPIREADSCTAARVADLLLGIQTKALLDLIQWRSPLGLAFTNFPLFHTPDWVQPSAEV